MPHLSKKHMLMDKIKFITKEDALKPMTDYFGIKYGDNSIVDKYEIFLKDLITEDSLEKTIDFLVYSKPFDFFLSENLYSYFDVKKEIYQEDSKITNYINSLSEFCLYILSKTREYDNIIKYFLT